MSNLNLSPVAQFIQSNFNKQTATQYKSNLDVGFAALSIISQQFAPHQTGTYITANGTGTGGTGTYTVNLSQTVGSSGSPVNFTTPEGNAFTGYISGITLTVTAVASGSTVTVGDYVQGSTTLLANMTVSVDPGNVMSNNTLTTHGVQTTGTFTAPVGNPRIDRVVINAATGAISTVTGTPAASPTPPAIPFGCLPCCQVLLQTSTTAIVNSMITDERAIYTGAGGSSLTENTIATNQSLGATNTGNNYVCTAALTLTVAQTMTLPSNWYNTVNAQGGNVTITPNASDKINGGAAGASIVVPKGYMAELTTDASGNLYVTMNQAAIAPVTLTSAATVDLGSAGANQISISGTTAITSFGASAQAGEMFNVTLSGALTLTYNATSLILPGGTNISGQAGDSFIVEALGAGNFRVTGYQTASGLSLVSSSLPGLYPLQTPSVAGNALTVGLNACTLSFRNATLASGPPVSATLAAALTLTVPSGATLGTVSGQQAELALLVAYNGGTPVLCIANMAGGVNLDESTLISPTTISSGATANNVIYSASAVLANSPFAVAGYVLVTETTAGVWAAAPTLCQPGGGMAMAALQSLGYGQAWHVVTGSRAVNTTYYNATPRPIMVNIQLSCNGTGAIYVNGTVGAQGSSNNNVLVFSLSTIVPPGGAYYVGSGPSLVSWQELY